MCTLCLPKERIMKSPLLGTTSCCRTRPRGHGCGPMLERSASEVLIMEVVGTESRPHSLEVLNEREGGGVMPLYFIRHGESEANERNQFAGHQDSPLTRLGVEQAKQAGRAIARKGLVFDEMHVSPLQRARFTAQQIAEVSGNTTATIHVSEALLERHFGLLQGRNKSLWKKVLGYRHYDEMLHSPHGIPPDGEAWQELYHRVRAYYEQVLLPASQSGRTILVVAHKYVVEMFALIVAGLAPEDSCDFKIPNSRPSSENELRSLATHVPQSVHTFGELLEVHLPLLLLGSA